MKEMSIGSPAKPIYKEPFAPHCQGMLLTDSSLTVSPPLYAALPLSNRTHAGVQSGGETWMPNWVTNKVRVIPNSKGASFEKVAKYVRGAETVKDVDGRTEIELEFDFNKLIPMPENVYRDDLPSDWKPTEQFPFNWYDWSNEHWNTKWNACNAHVNEEMEMFIFDTALSHPFPVIKALSERFPNNVFDVCFADEGIEENSGVYRIQAGEIA